jgi:hypothetical protein
MAARRRKATHVETPARLTRACATGRHARCLGTVLVYPPVDGVTLARCECPECKHEPPTRGRARRVDPTA